MNRGKKSVKSSKIGRTAFFGLWFLLFAFLSPLAWGALSTSESGGPSVRKAVFLSLLLPGAGEFYAGDMKSAKSLLGTEALIWTAHLGLREHGRWLREDYRAFARIHAGIDPRGKPDSYFDDIKFYTSSCRYNELAFREDGPEARFYPPNAWEWNSEGSRQRYRSLRNNSLLSYRCAGYMIGAAVVNRIISAINAARIVRKSKRQVGEVNRGDLQFSCSLLPPSLIILEFRW